MQRFEKSLPTRSNAADKIVVKFSDEQIAELRELKARSFTAMFIHPGLIGYGKIKTRITDDLLWRTAQSLVNCPITIGHPNITEENFNEVSKGFVSEVYRSEFDGKWFARFVVSNKDTIEKMDAGKLPFVSCVYKIPKGSEGEAGMLDGIEYDECPIDAIFTSLGLTDNPRINDTMIYCNEKNHLENYRVCDTIEYNEEKQNEKEAKMFGFKKIKVEQDNETLFATKSNENGLTAEQLVARVNELEDENAALKTENAELKKTAAEPAAPATEPVKPEDKPADGAGADSDKTLEKARQNDLDANGIHQLESECGVALRTHPELHQFRHRQHFRLRARNCFIESCAAVNRVIVVFHQEIIPPQRHAGFDCLFFLLRQVLKLGIGFGLEKEMQDDRPVENQRIRRQQAIAIRAINFIVKPTLVPAPRLNLNVFRTPREIVNGIINRSD